VSPEVSHCTSGSAEPEVWTRARRGGRGGGIGPEKQIPHAVGDAIFNNTPMRRSDTPDYDVLEQPPDEPIVLVGPPDRLQGELRLHNPGEEKLILRDARLRAQQPEKARAGTSALPELALRRIILRRGETRSVPFRVPADPHTPPGEYRGQFEVAGRTREVVMHITEMIRLEISPDQVLVENWPGETLRKQVVFTNGGNVPLVIGDIGPVVLDDTVFVCRTNRAAIAEVGDRVEKLDDYISELARQAKIALAQMGHLRVHFAGGQLRLEPGEVRLVDLEIRVPDGLDPRTRYVGSAAIYDTNLDFLITPTHAPPPRREPKKTKTTT
jgi:sorbitol-specific phosphotransferase system component IIA